MLNSRLIEGEKISPDSYSVCGVNIPDMADFKLPM